MIKILLATSAITVANLAPTHADPLEEAYKRGYEDGFKSGSTLAWSGSTTVLGGPDFSAIIAPVPGTNFQVGQDSAVAIVPKDALAQFKDKLGKDFIYDNKILMNDAATAK
ncbi:hypothetical protein [Mesorhizobium sp. M0478]|uniref:hypothetical protein n=1 Tax=Mesorhizobium sp. M0478 TaxID=2956947 RepID=UPI003336DE16